jgi:hypothetical protein
MNMQSNTKLIKEYNAQKDKASKDFLTKMTFIVNAMYNKNKNDGHLIEVRDGYMTAKNENPDCIVMLAGPQFWTYRQTINSGILDSLLDSDFKDDIAKIEGAEKYLEKIQIVMKKVKDTWLTFNADEQKVFKEKFKGMVGDYASYLKACKLLKPLEESNN